MSKEYLFMDTQIIGMASEIGSTPKMALNQARVAELGCASVGLTTAGDSLGLMVFITIFRIVREVRENAPWPRVSV